MDLETWEVYITLDVLILMTIFVAFPLYQWHGMAYKTLLVANLLLLSILGVLLVTLEDVIREEILRRSKTL